MVDMAVGEQDLLDRHPVLAAAAFSRSRSPPGSVKAPLHRLGAPDQAAILLQRRHRDDRGLERRIVMAAHGATGDGQARRWPWQARRCKLCSCRWTSAAARSCAVQGGGIVPFARRRLRRAEMTRSALRADAAAGWWQAMLDLAEVGAGRLSDRSRLRRRPDRGRGGAARRPRARRRHRSAAHPGGDAAARIAGVESARRFRRQDLFATPIYEASVVALYLLPRDQPAAAAAAADRAAARQPHRQPRLPHGRLAPRGRGRARRPPHLPLDRAGRGRRQLGARPTRRRRRWRSRSSSASRR